MQEVIRLESFADFGDRLNAFLDQWPDIRLKALQGAIIMGKGSEAGLLETIWERTPKSYRDRYIERTAKKLAEFRQTNCVLKLDDRWRVPRNWRKGAIDDEGHMFGERARARIDRYGMERLARSLYGLPEAAAGGRPTAESMLAGLKVESDGRSVTLTMRSDLEYARAVHDADKPAKGDWWAPGKEHGWSRKGTGAKFITGSVEDTRRLVFINFRDNVHEALHGVMSQ